ncbi:hypothetical protein [Peptostreptococcus sp. D1]|uniref:hypothetical protein n=1 Tax=Peptostreptococcus sp. D1 TaxID=72304 RepID=UPI0008E61950|nr:hypothetical protein [Peptostreptococcus sp. D1]SFE68435.1 hypothetical protein SAMN02910278_01452 [Peptostreptococcus sp. D1]
MLNKKISLLTASILLSSMLMMVACQISESADNEVSYAQKLEGSAVNIDKNFKKDVVEAIKGDIIRDIRNSYEKEDLEGLLPIVVLKIVGIKDKGDFYTVFANVNTNLFSFKEGLFTDESGSAYPVRYDLFKDFGIKKVHEAKDGGLFADSILELTENDRELSGKLSESQGYYPVVYKDILAELKNEAKTSGLKNYYHKINEIPGYESKVVKIKEKNIDGLTYVIKNDEYEKIKDNRKNKDNKKYLFAPCVLHDEATGITVSTIYSEQ